MELQIGQCSLQGPSWEENLDAVHVQRTANLDVCLVADGCGRWGIHGRGDSIAHWVVHELADRLRDQFSGFRGNEEPQDAIQTTVRSMNAQICDFSARRLIDNSGASMVLAVWQHDGALRISGVGDSRAYLFRNSGLVQLTVDDTLANALVQHGKLTVEESGHSPFRHVLWKYLGSQEVGDGPEVKCVPIQPGDKFLLCTDGLTHVLPAESLLSCIQDYPDPQRCAEAL